MKIGFEKGEVDPCLLVLKLGRVYVILPFMLIIIFLWELQRRLMRLLLR